MCQFCYRFSKSLSIKLFFKKKQKNTLQTFIKPVTIVYIIYFIIMTPEAERFNGWAAMLGFVAAVGAYVTTGQIIPGWF
jgi:uncharacterized membrane protein